MQTDFNLNIHLNLEASPELVSMLQAILQQGGSVSAEPAVQVTKAPLFVEPAIEEPTTSLEPEAKPLDTSDIRAAMEKTRLRIEGEDYKDKTSDGYAKYHKQLTKEFKNISALLGADLPSKIEGQDHIKSFIEQCETLTVNADDEVITQDAPY